MLGAAEPRGLTLAIGLSMVGHVVAFGAAIATASYRPHIERKPQTVLITKLVRLGKPRPEEWLPQKPVEPPPPSDKPAAVAPLAPVVPKPADAKPADKPVSARERLSQLSRVSQALSRLDRQADGQADGVTDGEVADLAHAVEGNRYATEISRCLKGHYAIEGISPDAVKNRTATVLIHVERDGTFIDSRIEQGSGLPAFDRAVEKALKLCGKVSPPPAGIRSQVRNDGIEVVFQP